MERADREDQNWQSLPRSVLVITNNILPSNIYVTFAQGGINGDPEESEGGEEAAAESGEGT